MTTTDAPPKVLRHDFERRWARVSGSTAACPTVSMDDDWWGRPVSFVTVCLQKQTGRTTARILGRSLRSIEGGESQDVQREDPMESSVVGEQQPWTELTLVSPN